MSKCSENDTILCSDKEDVKRVIDALGAKIKDWKFLEDGKIRIILCERLI